LTDRQHFVGDVTIVAREQFRLEIRRHLLVQQTVTIDAIDRVRAEFAFVDERLYRVNEIEAFILEIVGGCGRKHEQRRTGVPVGDERHFSV
jgi:hypothetical protein